MMKNKKLKRLKDGEYVSALLCGTGKGSTFPLLRERIIGGWYGTCLSQFNLRAVGNEVWNGDEKNAAKHVSETHWK